MAAADLKAFAGDDARLERTIASLDPVMALLSLVQLTGDRTLLHRYWDALDGKQETVMEAFRDINAHEEKEPVNPAVASDIRARLLAAVRSGRAPVMPQLDLPTFRRMSRLLLGKDLPEMSVEVAFQHGGFTTDTRVRKAQDISPADFKAIVVGAGMMGINAAIKLQQAGFDFEALDKVGGNWLTNTYPGAAVDTPSRVYSFSFEPNASWSQFYPRGPEFLSYLERVTDKYKGRHARHGDEGRGIRRADRRLRPDQRWHADVCRRLPQEPLPRRSRDGGAADPELPGVCQAPDPRLRVL
jgi:hypothetical protein